MRTLYLLRHAKSSWRDTSLRDFDRPLKERGRDAAEVVGRTIAAEKVDQFLVVSSPAERARETTEIMLRSSKARAELRFDPQIYESDLPTLLKVLDRIEDGQKVVILVGHNPGLELLLRFLTGEIRTMTTAALAKINLVANKWKKLEEGEGRLEWLITPKDILSSES